MTHKASAVLVLANGLHLYGQGYGYIGHNVGELCFNTSMTGYQEILTDPSYYEQIVVFTFPHIGNVGANSEDMEATPQSKLALGLITRDPPTAPSNYRANQAFHDWLVQHKLIGIAQVNTRALTHYVRTKGMLAASIAHNPKGVFDIKALRAQAKDFGNMAGKELASVATSPAPYLAKQTRWAWPGGYRSVRRKQAPCVVVIDYGAKHNILRCLTTLGCVVRVVPAKTTAKDILAFKPDGLILSNGPGDPAATARYATPIIRDLLKTKLPLFGICLGHQLLALALGGKTQKMSAGHHGANHPVQDVRSKKVEVTSMNHGFTVAANSLPADVEETHISLFDGSNCGLRVKNRPVFSVQYHPEASPGPQDSFYLFDTFVNAVHAQTN